MTSRLRALPQWVLLTFIVPAFASPPSEAEYAQMPNLIQNPSFESDWMSNAVAGNNRFLLLDQSDWGYGQSDGLADSWVVSRSAAALDQSATATSEPFGFMQRPAMPALPNAITRTSVSDSGLLLANGEPFFFRPFPLEKTDLGGISRTLNFPKTHKILSLPFPQNLVVPADQEGTWKLGARARRHSLCDCRRQGSVSVQTSRPFTRRESKGFAAEPPERNRCAVRGTLAQSRRQRLFR